MGIDYTAWIGTEDERIEQVDFYRDYNLVNWLSRYPADSDEMKKCVHPGCGLVHRVQFVGRYIGYPTDLSPSEIRYIEWALEGKLPEGIDDPLFEEAVAKLDKTESRGNTPPRETLGRLLELRNRLLDLKQELRELRPEAYYPAWPDERRDLVRNAGLWIEGV